MSPSTQDALDRLRRNIEAAKIQAAQLESVLGAPSAQAAPLPPPPVPYAPSPVYANLPVPQPSAASLNVAAVFILPPSAARLSEQAAYNWQHGGLQNGASSAWHFTQPPFQ